MDITSFGYIVRHFQQADNRTCRIAPAHESRQSGVDAADIMQSMSHASQRATHWQRVYLSKADYETSWYQADPAMSLQLIRGCAPPNARIVDTGGGTSALAGILVQDGYAVTVLDISQAALDRARQRIGSVAEQIRWIVGDVTEIDSIGQCDVWHDRAVFHFLTEESDRQRYITLAARSIVPGGHAVIGTFAPNGPEKCSGLPVQRYDAGKLQEVFAEQFSIVSHCDELHQTPWGSQQAFTYAVLRLGRGYGAC